MIKPPIEERVRDYVAAERASIQQPPWLAAGIHHAVESARPAPERKPFRGVQVAALVGGFLVIAASLAGTRMLGAPPSPADAVQGTWSSVPGMAVRRGYHSATLLPSGKVLVVGGFDQAPGSLSSAELYDPATRRWTSAGSLATPRFNHPATLLRRGQVLVVGGQDDASVGLPMDFGHGQSSAELYDPLTNRWSPAASMATVRTEHTATLLADGRVLVAGGYTPATDRTGLLWDGKVSASAELYDPVSNRWTTVGPLGTARAMHSAVVLPDHRVLVLGGVDLAYMQSNLRPSLQSAELYDPSTQTWSPAPSMQYQRIHPTSTLLPNGRVLVVADDRARAAAELFDPVAGRWLLVPDMGRYHDGLVAVALRNGDVLVAGGIGDTRVRVYDWRRNAWRGGGALTITPASPSGSALRNGQVLLAGGFGPYEAYGNVQVYDPSGKPVATVVRRTAAGALGVGLWPLLGIGLLLMTVALWSFRRRAARRDDSWLDIDP